MVTNEHEHPFYMDIVFDMFSEIWGNYNICFSNNDGDGKSKRMVLNCCKYMSSS